MRHAISQDFAEKVTYMNRQLVGKVAIVTGGSSGIGKTTAVGLAQEGAKVVVAGRNETGLIDTVEKIKASGGEGLFIQTDVSRSEEVKAMVMTTIEKYGRLDCAFNNAGGYARIGGEVALTAEISEDTWDQVMNVNLKGVWLCMKYEIPEMLKVGGGSIVNTSSVDALRGEPYVAPYCASKSGLLGLMKASAWEYGKYGIRINSVCPGLVRTPPVEGRIQSDPEHEERWTSKKALGRIGEPEEISAAVVWLCSDASSFVTGHTMVVDGGFLA